MTSKVRQAPVYVMWEDPVKPKIRAMPVYLMVTEPNGMPKSVSGTTAIFNLVNDGTELNLKVGDVTIGLPEVTTEHGCNTKILITAVEGNDLNLIGSFYLFYNRAPMSRIDLLASYRLSSTDSTTSTALGRININSGMALTMNDLVNNPVVGSSLKLEPSAANYFFEPGTFITLIK